MNNDFKSVLLRILESIDYTNDKEAFSNQFLGFINAQSINDLITSLSTDQQESIKNELTVNQNNPEKMGELKNLHLVKSKYKKLLKKLPKTRWLNGCRQ